MDDLDHLVIAQERAEKRFTDQRLKGLNNSRVISATDCIDCGDPIPKARQKAIKGVQRCVPCQSLSE
ncbi:MULTISPECIES: TraR/DksA C4-type zinc finger protein [unclassified Pseudoalteromonas]|jgi:phage/conjugal plasmid C-4 type zinc finger TraR family protein|uniref:TraR/DksA C4-type zinc finger protein n=1 Tax=Pseudoalteromonas sp. SD03 TaxID=3231719 RepID=A0AB39ATD9_9GAMM|nr:MULTISPECIES: TraR/DksA C4-type zinc finger protein [unclassified Pseudoalteromonas]TMP73531.1 conjugal transfer protein TraR [Pseudoalteromonas sp. S1608]|tara:strand:+ start:2441 stop:2641 length:201 start_codon:yes stop_codon:yes gene_type:complete